MLFIVGGCKIKSAASGILFESYMQNGKKKKEIIYKEEDTLVK